MCMACPMKDKCEFVQPYSDCSQCQYVVKDSTGNVVGCACPPAKAQAATMTQP